MESFGAAFPKIYEDPGFKGWWVSSILLSKFGSWSQTSFAQLTYDFKLLGLDLLSMVQLPIDLVGRWIWFMPSSYLLLDPLFRLVLWILLCCSSVSPVALVWIPALNLLRTNRCWVCRWDVDNGHPFVHLRGTCGFCWNLSAQTDIKQGISTRYSWSSCRFAAV